MRSISAVTDIAATPQQVWAVLALAQETRSQPMTSIIRETSIATTPEAAWGALRDFGALHELASGFVTSTKLEDDRTRVVTFFNGATAREALIGIGTFLLMVTRRDDLVVTTGITTAVVMVVAALSPHDAWQQPILRSVDTLVGVVVGIAAATFALRASSSRTRSTSKRSH